MSYHNYKTAVYLHFTKRQINSHFMQLHIRPAVVVGSEATVPTVLVQGVVLLHDDEVGIPREADIALLSLAHKAAI